MAWDFFIQLIYFDNSSKSFKQDGIFSNDHEIVMCSFTSDSVLMISDISGKIKLVYTRKFCTGDFLQDDVRELRDLSKYAELDKKLLPQVKTINKNHYASIAHHGRQVIFLREPLQITRCLVYTHEEFLNKLSGEEHCSWLTLLKACLEIYHGEMRGFAELYDTKKEREQ